MKRIVVFAFAVSAWLVLCAFCGPRSQLEAYTAEHHDHHWSVLDAHAVTPEPSIEPPAFCVDVRITCPRNDTATLERWTFARSAAGVPGTSGYSATHPGCGPTAERVISCDDGCASGYCVRDHLLLTCGGRGMIVGPNWVGVPGHASSSGLVAAVFGDAVRPDQVLSFTLRFALGGPEYARQACPRIIADE